MTAVTVFWMMCVCSAMAAELAFLLIWIGVAAGWITGTQLPMLGGLMLLVASFTGMLSLILTFVVWKMRTIPPPRSILSWAITVGLTPLVLFAMAALVQP